jgi:2-C-methyl-D-erythritol 4-phosphate cytidylyltransferase
MTKYVIIVAGGAGKRMQSDLPKQFLLLNGIPVLMRTMVPFFNFDNQIQIILVLPEEHMDYWKNLCVEFNFQLDHKIVAGGETRFRSVKNGLTEITDTGSLVAVHDGVRPLVSQSLIQTCFETAELMGNAVPAMEISESLRILTPEGNQLLNRSEVKLIQTPQIFRAEQILKAYRQDYKETITDDASVVENMGEKIHIVPGNRENIKITTLHDMVIASALLQNMRSV